jgi:hypothetical protein
MLDGRILDGLLGLELDVIRSNDKGSGTVNFSGLGETISVKQTIGQAAWHLPLLAKITFPSPLIAPMIFLGPEFVFPGSGSSETSVPVIGVDLRAHADHYVMITAGGGVEIKLPLPVIDLRIPVGIRASFNPSVPSGFNDRVKTSGTDTVTYYSAWKYAVNFTAGAALYF